MKFVISDYNPQWIDKFNAEKETIASALTDIASSIDHIGSTSVPGLGAKNIIDILIGIRSEEDMEKTIEPMMNAGYTYYKLYEEGMPYRRYFVKLEPVTGLKPPKRVDTQQDKPSFDDFARSTHIHCIPKDSYHWMRHIAFRDYLRTFPGVRDEYFKLKKDISARDFKDMLDYNDAKDDWIKITEQKAVEWYKKNGR